ncbi:uncharacterized protein LY79DRAFT_294572 [Colletotrichum navitas]|uniref:Uncharacterized protein n=1 Tax=Colletotrichum navitas TaxID=681940 RepID=A0AAD8V102_9PEZI|nr:uncharacterized protein LY79DRAFT_294572 [Colletotrichum navitas]KAK1584766.1 hypothetical protein LY79DRAFT_294572 [Colletotrichum navitas]
MAGPNHKASSFSRQCLPGLTALEQSRHVSGRAAGPIGQEERRNEQTVQSKTWGVRAPTSYLHPPSPPPWNGIGRQHGNSVCPCFNLPFFSSSFFRLFFFVLPTASSLVSNVAARSRRVLYPTSLSHSLNSRFSTRSIINSLIERSPPAQCDSELCPGLALPTVLYSGQNKSVPVRDDQALPFSGNAGLAGVSMNAKRLKCCHTLPPSE